MCIIISSIFYCNSSFMNELFFEHVHAARAYPLVLLNLL